MLELRKEQSEDVPVRWRNTFRAWQSHMGVVPVNAPGDVLLAAEGVDGRVAGVIRRSLGYILIDDIKRSQFRGDTYELTQYPATSPTTNGEGYPGQATYVSAKRVYDILNAGNDFILDCYPFEISAHNSSDPSKTARGFVLRLQAGCLGKGLFGFVGDASTGVWQDNAVSYVNFTQSRPFLALLVLDGDETSDLTINTSLPDGRFRFIIPMTPVERWYNIGGATYSNAIPHYKDYSTSGQNWPNFTPEDAGVASDVIYADDPITVSHTDRFLFLYSKTGEFQPVTVWLDTEYGLPFTGPYTGTSATMQSSRSRGWHWEKFGVSIGQPLKATLGSPASGGTIVATKYYDVAHRWRDPYRNRWTQLGVSNYILPTYSGTALLFFASGNSYSDGASKYALSTAFPAYEVWSSIGQTNEPGGTLRFNDLFMNRYWRYTDRGHVYDKLVAGTESVSYTYLYSIADREDKIVYSGTSTTDADVSNKTESSLANVVISPGYDYLENDPSDAVPSKILAATDLQGVHVFATVDEVAGAATSGSQVDGLLLPSSRVTWRWSFTASNFVAATPAPEVIPEVHRFPSKMSAQQPVAVVRAGDFAIGFGEGSIVRFQLVGSGMEVLEVGAGFALGGKKAACEVKGQAFAVFRDGAYFIEPNTGTANEVGVLDRIIRDVWQPDLTEVQVEYDHSLDAIFLLNPVKRQLIQLWLRDNTMTCQSDIPWQHLGVLRWQNQMRVALVSRTGRFTVPRLYSTDSVTDGSFTLQAIEHTQTEWPSASRLYYLQLTPVTFNAGVNATECSISDSNAAKVFFREGWNNIVRDGSTTYDYYWYGLSLYSLAEASYGTKYTVVAVKGKPGTAGCRVLLQGNLTGLTLPLMSVDPIPFGLLGGPLESEPGMVSGDQKRSVTDMSVVVSYLPESPPTGAALMEAGVLDYDSVRLDSTTTYFFRTGTTALEQSRRGVIPQSGRLFLTDNPSTGYTHVGATGASGHVLFPYIRSYATLQPFDVKEFSAIGAIGPSSSTLSAEL